MTHLRRLSRLVTALGVALLVALLVVGALTLPAGAHGATGTMGIEVTPGSDPLTAKVRILLEYANDRDVVPGATVVAEATGPDGATVPATPLVDRGQGSYDAVLTLPSAGTWTVTVTATDPTATASAEVVVVAAAAAGSEPDGPGTTSTTVADVQISADRTTQDATESEGGGPSAVLLAAIAVVLVAAAGAGFLRVRRR